MNTRHRIASLLLLLPGLMVAGCSHGQKPRPLAPQFNIGAGNTLRTQKPMNADPLSGADQPGALLENPRSDPDLSQVPGGPGGQAISRTVQENVTAPGEHRGEPLVAEGSPSTNVASTGPAAPRMATTIGTSSGKYLIIGSVVEEINGTAIYANRVISLSEPALAAQARGLEPDQFRKVARKEIMEQIMALRRLELEYAAAERNLDQKDKDLADALTMQWKQRQITAAGGSLELAKHAAAERGEDFEDLVKQQYRVMMSRIFYEKKIIPRIQVSAAEMRAFYDRNRDRLFTDRGVAQFRLIKIDVRKHEGRDKAYQLIGELRNRIVKAGEPFEAIARSVNDDPRLLRTGGDVGKIEQNSFAIEKVDQAVWATPDGQVTPIIDTGDAFFIAQVMEKKVGRVLGFEDEAVQQKITDTLRAEQFRKAREEEQKKLVSEAVVRTDPEMFNSALEMAMQNYPRWSGR